MEKYSIQLVKTNDHSPEKETFNCKVFKDKFQNLSQIMETTEKQRMEDLDFNTTKTEIADLEFSLREITMNDSFILDNISKEDNSKFKNLDQILKTCSWDYLLIKQDIIKGLIEMGHIQPSKVQATTYPIIMKKPYDHLIAQFPNGHGKTGGFSLAALSRVNEQEKNIQIIVFCHTRELVNQTTNILKQMAKYTNIKITSIIRSVESNEGQIIVTTPGYFENIFIKRKNMEILNYVKLLIIDEADFIITNENTGHVIEKIFKYYKNRLDPCEANFLQVLLFSATFNKSNFISLKKYLPKIFIIEQKKEQLDLKNIRQMYYICENSQEKVTFVSEFLKRSLDVERVIIFVNTRDYTEKLHLILSEKGYKVHSLLGSNLDVQKRDETIRKFNKGEIQVLITTNVLSRGFDEKLVKLVINFDIPFTFLNGVKIGDNEIYLHRVGRTGRFGAKGLCLTLLASKMELQNLRQIQEYFQSDLEEITCLNDLLNQFKDILSNKF